MSKNLDDLSKQIIENKANGWQDLSDAQKLFGIHYVESYVIKTAAEYANVGVSVASKWLREPLMLEFINELQSHLNNRSVITKDFINVQWLKLMPKLLGEEEVAMVDKDGIAYERKKFHSTEAVSLLKELSKSTDFYEVAEMAEINTKPVAFIVKTKEEVDAEDDNG